MTGEIKFVRTHPDFLRKSMRRRLLEHIVQQERGHGMRRLSLETGAGPAFDPALALYRSYGFSNGEVFTDYQRSKFNQFMHLDL